MLKHNPQEAITEYVRDSVDDSQQNQPSSMKGAVVHFLQMRSLPHCQLHEIMLEVDPGQQRHWLCFLVKDGQGFWSVHSAADIPHDAPVRSFPWVNLAGCVREDEFWAGGRVIDNGLDVDHVRLIAKNGSILEDTVQDGVVLLVTDQKVQIPCQVELYNRSGNVIGTHTFPYYLSQPT